MTRPRTKKPFGFPDIPKTINAVATDGSVSFVAAGDGDEQKQRRINMVAYTGGALNVGFGVPVYIDLAGLYISDKPTPLMLEHGRGIDAIFGQTDSVKIENGQVIASGPVLGVSDETARVVALADAGFAWQASIGVEIQSRQYVRRDETVKVNGKSVKGDALIVRRGSLREISVVSIGADQNASTLVASQSGDATKGQRRMNEKLKAWIEAKGLDVDDLDDGELATLKAQYKTELMAELKAVGGGEPAKAANKTAGQIDEALADAHRCAALESMAMAAITENKHNVKTVERIRDIMVEAQNDGTSARDFEIKLLRASIPDRVNVNVRNNETSPSILTAAAMISGGIGDEDTAKECGAQNVEAAQRRFGREMGLQEIIMAAAELNGYRGRGRVTVGNWRETWAYASGMVNAAGYSTVNLPNILGNVANKAMAKIAAEPRWLAPMIAGKANHSNFHAHTVCSMAANGTLESVGAGGELQSMNLSEETYTRQVGTRGAVLRLSRQDIINDNLGAFTTMAANMARKSYNAREKALFTLINASGAGSSHFTAARGNYVTGQTVGTKEDLAQMIKAFRLLTGPDGEPMNVDPSIIICGPLYESAFGILLGTFPALVATGVGNAAKLSGATNIYAGKFGGAPLVSPYIENVSAGGSTTSTYSYLLADPNVLPAYEIAYLNGVESPTVEYFGLDQDVDSLGVAWRIYWDFGVAAAEWRAGVKSAGS
jgi:hypothetical protein